MIVLMIYKRVLASSNMLPNPLFDLAKCFHILSGLLMSMARINISLSLSIYIYGKFRDPWAHRLVGPASLIITWTYHFLGSAESQPATQSVSQTNR